MLQPVRGIPGPMTDASTPPPTPGQRRQPRGGQRRWAVALLGALHAPVFIWAAIVLPWRIVTVFSIVTALLAALHVATAILTLIPHARAPRVWRVTSLCSLAYLAYLTFGLLSSAVYVASLNRGVGSGVAAGLAAVWAIVALVTLPF